ncbi:MAG: metallophosphoesterase family protein, partial [Isosphaeraceae bacterium]
LAHDRPETFSLPDLDVAIHGQSFAKEAVTENLALAYPAPVKGCVNIGLLHTGLGGAEGHERYAPCTLEDLRLRRYDYWALGHIHRRETPCQDPPVAFPGNVQGRHIRESGPKGCLLVTVGSDRSFETSFHRLDHVRWERGRVELSELDTESDLLGRVAETLDGLLATEPDPDHLLAVRVVLSGTTGLHDRINADPDRFVAEVRSLASERGGDRLWLEKVESQTRPPLAVAVPEGPIEELLDVVKQLGEDSSSWRDVVDDLAELKRKLPSDLIHDPETPRLGDVEWLATLLGQAQPLLLDLLRRSQSGGDGRSTT